MPQHAAQPRYGGVVGVVAGMEVELDVEVDSIAPGWTAAHDGQIQTH